MKKFLQRASMLIVMMVAMINILFAEAITPFVIGEPDASLIPIIKKSYPNDSIEIYVSKKEFAKDDTIKLMGGEMFTVPFDCHVVFADLEPYANWSHACEYLLISTDMEQKSVMKNDMPPVHLLESFSLLRQGIYTRGKLIKPQYKPANNIRKKSPGQGNSVSSDKYAVIINGGGDVCQNYVRYWNECSAMYQTLTAHGYSSSNIYVAMSDGTNPAIDLKVSSMYYMSSPLDLDGDGNDDIQYAATRENIEYIFEELSDVMDAEDDLFIFMTGHGAYVPGLGDLEGLIFYNKYILWGDNSYITDAEFANLLTPIQAHTINILMEQNYSGGFIDDFANRDNIVITTACSIGERSHAMQNGAYSEFIYYWLSGVNGSTPSMYPYYSSQPITDSADENQDGYVSMEEAYNYAAFHDMSGESPLLEAHPYCLASSLALDALLDYCDGSLLISGWDLYMKDDPLDMGAEPNQTTGKSWISDAIWFEENGQRVNTLQSGMTYDVCVLIQNRGVDPSPGTATLYVHWTKAQIGGTWPWGWFGDYTYDCGGTPVRRGDLCGSEVLPSIGGGRSYVARIPWTTPNVLEYSTCIEFGGENLAELWHYCILARIVDTQEQPDENITDLGLGEFVLNHNNVVSRNLTVMGVQDDGISEPKLKGLVAFNNPKEGEDSGPYTLECQIRGATNWDNLAAVRLTFNTNFMISQPNMTWQNCHTNNIYGSFDLQDSAKFENLYFSGNDNAMNIIYLEVFYYDTYDEWHYPEFIISIHLWDESQQKYVGGEEFIFINERPELFNIVRHTNSDNIAESIEHMSIPIENALSIDVYDMQGQQLKHCEKCDVESLDIPKGVYILRVQTDNQYYETKIIK